MPEQCFGYKGTTCEAPEVQHQHSMRWEEFSKKENIRGFAGQKPAQWLDSNIIKHASMQWMPQQDLEHKL